MTNFDQLWKPFALSFDALKTKEGLESLDQLFLNSLSPELKNQIEAWRKEEITLSEIETSELQIKIAEALNQFISNTLQIQKDTEFYFTQAKDEATVLQFKDRSDKHALITKVEIFSF